MIRVAAACVRHKVPITARGGGTGNYGQAVPLQGGVVLDMTALDTIEWQRPGMLRVGPGRKMIDIDRETRPDGWELRMHPSTKRSATIGGFVAGGSGGVGSVTWGGLREPGNVAAARIVTMEAEPRIIELREAEAQAVNHAYRHHRPDHRAGDAAGAGVALDRLDRCVPDLHRCCAVRPRGARWRTAS